MVISNGVDPPEPSSPKAFTSTTSIASCSRIAVFTASPRAPARSRCAALPPRAYDTGNDSCGASQEKTSSTTTAPRIAPYSRALGYADASRMREAETSASRTMTAALARTRWRAGTIAYRIVNSVTDSPTIAAPGK